MGTDIPNPGDSINIHVSPSDAGAGTCQYDIRVLGQQGEEGVLYKIALRYYPGCLEAVRRRVHHRHAVP